MKKIQFVSPGVIMCLVRFPVAYVVFRFPAAFFASVFSPQFLGNVGVVVSFYNVSCQMPPNCISCICWVSLRSWREVGCNRSVAYSSRNNGQRKKKMRIKFCGRGGVVARERGAQCDEILRRVLSNQSNQSVAGSKTGFLE